MTSETILVARRSSELQSSHIAQHRQNIIRNGAVLVLVLCATFNTTLCFINTKGFVTTANTAAIAEFLIIGMAGLLLLTAGTARYFLIALVLILANFTILFALRGVDPKPVRDLMIPVIFMGVGAAVAHYPTIDKAFKIITAVTVIFSIFEYLQPGLYTSYFNILSYFINKGVTPEEAATYISTGLNINGERPASQGRELLGFMLSNHRSSSIFLEPVTAGNFAAIAAAWFLHSKRRALRKCMWVFGCITISILADGRFGFFLLLAAIGLYFAKRLHDARLWSLTPLVLCICLIVYPLLFEIRNFPNDLQGRIAYSGHIFTTIDVFAIFGISGFRPLFDAGYAYSMTQFGLLGFVVCWIALCVVSVRYGRSIYFISFALLFISLSLMLSNSFYSIKASALLWAGVGCLLAVGQGGTELPSLDGQRKQPAMWRRTLDKPGPCR